VGPAIERLVAVYLRLRAGPAEPFARTMGRLGAAPFRAALQGVAETGETRAA
jgi:hypothetical protein